MTPSVPFLKWNLYLVALTPSHSRLNKNSLHASRLAQVNQDCNTVQLREFNSCNFVPSIAATQHVKCKSKNQLQHIPPKIAAAQHNCSWPNNTRRLLSGQHVSLPALAEALEVEAGADTMGMTCVAAVPGGAGAAAAPAGIYLGVTARHSRT